MKYSDLNSDLQQLVLNLVMQKAENGDLHREYDAIHCLALVVAMATADIPVEDSLATKGEPDPDKSTSQEIDWELVHNHNGELGVYKHPTDPNTFLLSDGILNAVIRKEKPEDRLPPCEVLISMLKAAGKPN